MTNKSNQNVSHDQNTPGISNDEITKTLERINFWIVNCDTKISFSLAFAGVLLGGFFASSIITGSLGKLIDKITAITQPCQNALLYTTFLLLMAFLICLTTATICFFRGLKGTIGPEVYLQVGLTTDSTIFFNTIANQPFQSFKEKASIVSGLDIKNDYLSQVYINSNICKRKFQLYNSGVNFLVVSIGLFIVLNALFLFLK